MTFTRKFNGKTAPPNEPIVATYTCPQHGEFDAEVQRDENGEAPDVIECFEEYCPNCECISSNHRSKRDIDGGCPECPSGWAICRRLATWTPSPSIACRVRRVEVVRGGWEKPERKTWLDTRKLGEGQSVEEFQKERRKVWNERRHQRVKELLR